MVSFKEVMEGVAYLEEVGRWGQVHRASVPGSFLSHTLFPALLPGTTLGLTTGPSSAESRAAGRDI